MTRFVPFRLRPVPMLLMGGFILAAMLMGDILFLPTGWILLYFLGPALIAYALAWGGIVPCAVCLTAAIAAWGRLGGTPGCLAAAVYYIPTLAVFVFLEVHEEKESMKPVLFLAAAALFSQMILLLMLQKHYEGQAFQRLADAAASAFAGSQEGMSMLYLLSRSGVLGLSGISLEGITVENGALVMSPEQMNQLLSALTLTVEDLLGALVPGLLISFSLYSGALTAAFPVSAARSGLRRIGDDEGAGKLRPLTPPFRRWYLPRKWGLRIGVLGAVGFVALMLPGTFFESLGTIFLQLFMALFVLQALAMVHDLQCRRNRRTWWKILLPGLLMILLGDWLWIAGLADQWTDPRKLRVGEKNMFRNDHKEDGL